MCLRNWTWWLKVESKWEMLGFPKKLKNTENKPRKQTLNKHEKQALTISYPLHKTRGRGTTCAKACTCLQFARKSSAYEKSTYRAHFKNCKLANVSIYWYECDRYSLRNRDSQFKICFVCGFTSSSLQKHLFSKKQTSLHFKNSFRKRPFFQTHLKLHICILHLRVCWIRLCTPARKCGWIFGHA